MIVLQNFSNLVLGQNRVFGQGPFYKTVPQNVSNHVLGRARGFWAGPILQDRATHFFEACPWSAPAPRAGRNLEEFGTELYKS